MRQKVFTIAVAFAIAGGYASLAAADDDWQTCRKAQGDSVIAACASAISSGKLNGHDLAVAYLNRGLGRMAKGDNQTAIADCEKAIELDPDFVEAFINRGVAYQNLGQYDKAIPDFKHASTLDPKSSVALRKSRSCL
jgi:Tfp pilus assembly protein PilF